MTILQLQAQRDLLLLEAGKAESEKKSYRDRSHDVTRRSASETARLIALLDAEIAALGGHGSTMLAAFRRSS